MVLRLFKMIATIGFLAALACIEFVFGRDSARTRLGSLQRSPRPSSWFKGTTSKGKGKGRENVKGEKKGSERGRDGPPPFQKFLDPLLDAVILRI